jgi:hypothetical protein
MWLLKQQCCKDEAQQWPIDGRLLQQVLQLRVAIYLWRLYQYSAGRNCGWFCSLSTAFVEEAAKWL